MTGEQWLTLGLAALNIIQMVLLAWIKRDTNESHQVLKDVADSNRE